MSDEIAIPECEKWAKVAPEFKDIMESVETLEAIGINVDASYVQIEKAFMKHKGIDRDKLEQERSALLEQAQAKAKENQQPLDMEN